MKVVYVGADAKKRRKYLDAKGDVLLLLYDRWDDYNFKTSFPTSCRIAGSIVDLGAIRILVEDKQVTSEYAMASMTILREEQTENDKRYRFEDPFFASWIRLTGGH